MQIKTAVKFDQETFDRLKRSIKNMSLADRERKINPGYATYLPEEIGIQLTYRCNMRCKHCYQWNDIGFFNNFTQEKQKLELDVDIITKILKDSREEKSNLYIWGGEPLFHKEWDEISKILEKEQRWTVMCTNGILLEKKLESILRISSNLALLISIDGFENAHDNIRGNGTYNRLMNNIKLLLNLQKKGEYHGKISLYCVLNKWIVPKLYDFMGYCESLGVDTLYYGFPWYISKKTANEMDKYYYEKFSWLNHLDKNHKPSWHSYTYHLDPSQQKILQEQINKLITRIWNIRIRFQPAVEQDEMDDFIVGKDRVVQKRKHCLAISNRMDIHADGKAGPCKFFPEFSIGDLYKQTLKEIWQSNRYGKLREIINSGLMPICSKCVLLYLHGK